MEMMLLSPRVVVIAVAVVVINYYYYHRSNSLQSLAPCSVGGASLGASDMIFIKEMRILKLNVFV